MTFDTREPKLTPVPPFTEKREQLGQSIRRLPVSNWFTRKPYSGTITSEHSGIGDHPSSVWEGKHNFPWLLLPARTTESTIKLTASDVEVDGFASREVKNALEMIGLDRQPVGITLNLRRPTEQRQRGEDIHTMQHNPYEPSFRITLRHPEPVEGAIDLMFVAQPDYYGGLVGVCKEYKDGYREVDFFDDPKDPELKSKKAQTLLWLYGAHELGRKGRGDRFIVDQLDAVEQFAVDLLTSRIVG